MKRLLRDNQRELVYQAEEEFEQQFDMDLVDLDEIVEYVNKVINIEQISKKFDYVLEEQTINVHMRRSHCTASVGDEDGIGIDPASKKIIVVLHELAHCLQFRLNFEDEIRFAGHDSTFTSVYLFLVRYAIGVLGYNCLKRQFDKFGVKYVDLIPV